MMLESFLAKALVALVMVLPPAAAKVGGIPRRESWWWPDPDKRLYYFKLHLYAFRAAVAESGMFGWVVIGCIAATCFAC